MSDIDLSKRRYAHELYPHAEDWQTRPLTVEVPYLYARAIGYSISGTSWSKVEPPSIGGPRCILESQLNIDCVSSVLCSSHQIPSCSRV